MRYRIKEIKGANGVSLFFPQRRIFGFWRDFKRVEDARVSFTSMQKCERFFESPEQEDVEIHVFKGK